MVYMDDFERKKLQRQEINRRAYLRRINGDVKNYSKNSDNDYKYIKFLKHKGKIKRKEDILSPLNSDDEEPEIIEERKKDVYWSNMPELNNNNDANLKSSLDDFLPQKKNAVFCSDIDEERYNTDLNYRLNPDIMRKQDEQFNNRMKAVNMAKTLYPQHFNTGFPYLV